MFLLGLDYPIFAKTSWHYKTKPLNSFITSNTDYLGQRSN